MRCAAHRATTKPEESTAICPASAANDSDPERNAATSSTVKIVAVTASAAAKRPREACACE